MILCLILNISCYEWSFSYDNLESWVALDLISNDFSYKIFYYKFLISNLKCYLYAMSYLVYALVYSMI